MQSQGINTTSPGSALHIIGTFNATPAASAASTSLFVNATGGAFYKNGEVCTAENSFCANTGNGWADDGSIVRLVTQSDFVGIGTSNPSEKLYVSGNGTFTGDLVVNGNLLSNGGQGSGGNVGGWFDDGTVIRLNTISDFVGIGTATPTDRLDVNGNTTIRGNFTVGSNAFFVNNNGSGNVGIGTTTPGARLDVRSTTLDDTIRLVSDGTNGAMIRFYNGATYVGNIGASGSDSGTISANYNTGATR